MVGRGGVPRLPSVFTDAVLDVPRLPSLVLHVHAYALRCQRLIRPDTQAAIRLPQPGHALLLGDDAYQRAPLARLRRLR